MAFQGIVTGFTPNDGQGDTLLAGAIKTNDNFRELYEALGDGTSIGIATLTQLKLSGILTATSVDVPDINISGILSASNVQVSGVVTANSFSGDLNGNVVATSFNSLGSLSVGNQVRITSAGALQNIVSAATSSLTVTGDSTFTNVTAGVVTATEFNGLFNGTFTGNSIGLSGSPDIEVGIVTANTSIGIATSAGNAYLTFPIGDSISSSDIIRAGNSILDYSLYALKNGTQHYIRQYTSGYYNVSVGSTNAFVVSNSDSFVTDGAVAPSGVTDSDISFVVNPDTSTELRYNYNKKFETTGVGVTVFGTTESQQLSVSGVSTFSGNVNIGTAATTVDLPGLYLKGNSAEQNFIANPSISIGGTTAGNWYDTFLVDGPNLQYVRHWASNFDVNFSVPDDRIFVVSNTDGSSSVSPAGVVDGHIAFKINPQTSTELRYNKVKKFETTGYGVSVTGGINVSGVSTFQDNIVLTGVGKSIQIGPTGDQLSLEYDSGGLGLIRQNNNLFLLSPTITVGNLDSSKTSAAFSPTGSVELYHNNSKKLETTASGINVTGHTETDTLNVSGVATAAGFVGPLTGDATGLSGSPSITVTNITASGNVSIAGTLTYEDVTNIDAIGLITARSGVQVDSGGIDVTGVSTFQNDVAFGGVVSLGDINNGLGNLRLGDNDDLRFYHNGANSYITNATGSLYLTALQDNERVHIRSDDGSGGTTDYFAAYGNSGEAILYHYGNQKLATKPGGIEVGGLTDTHDLKVAGIATLGSHTLDANDFKVGTTLNFKNSDGSSNILTLDQSGSVDLYHNTNKKFETTASGVEVTGGLVADNLSISGVSTVAGNVILNADLDMRDNDQIIMGDGSDLKIYHDGANSYVSDVGTGDLRLSGNVVKFNNQNNTATMVKATQGGSVELNFNNSKKFETTGVGASVLGTLEVSSFVEIGSGLNVSGVATATTFNGALHGTALLSEGLTGTPDITVDDITAAQINVSGLTTTTNKVEVRSTDSTPGRVDLFCEVSNAHYARLQAPFHSAFSGNVVATLPTKSGNLIVGDSAVIDNDINTSGIITASSFSGSGSNLTSLTGASAGSYGGGFVIPVITVDANGRITGISTAANAGAQGGGGGISNVVDDTAPQLGGTLDTNGNLIKFGDSSGATDDRLKFGAGDDLQIYHDSNNSIIEDTGEGFLGIRGESLIALQSLNGSENYAIFNKDGAVELYHNNSQKFRTLSTGATITGTLSATSFSGDGSNLTGIVTSLVAGSNVTLGVSGGRVTINASGGGGGGGTGINVQNNGVAIGSTTTQTINFNNDLEATVNGSVVTVNSTAPSQATAIALAIALG